MNPSNKSKRNKHKLYKSILNITTFVVAILFLIGMSIYIITSSKAEEKVENKTISQHSIKDTFSLEKEGVSKPLPPSDFIEEEVEVEKIKENPKTIKAVATAYTAFCDTGCIGVTKTGYDVSNTVYYEDKRVIAVDPKVIPLHSIVEVTYGDESFKAVALDTGGDIKNTRI